MLSLLEQRIRLQRALSRPGLQALRRQLKKVREESLECLPELIKSAKQNFKAQRVWVYEVRKEKEFDKLIRKLVPAGAKVVKSKSSLLAEFKVKEKLKGRNEVVETDCGDWVVELCGAKPAHPLLPALQLSCEQIAQRIEQKFGVKLKPEPPRLMGWIKNHLRQQVCQAQVGLTGANAIAAEGAVLLVENEGNISLVSRLPKRHVVVAGIEKLVPSLQDAVLLCQLQALHASAAQASYLNIITGPSKTLDLEGKLTLGAQATEELYLLLIDCGRRKWFNLFKELFLCINCGACLYACPTYLHGPTNYGVQPYLGGKSLAMLACNDLRRCFEAMLYACTACGACEQFCPVGINWAGVLRHARQLCAQLGLETEANRKMLSTLKRFNNPFGKLGARALQLFCC